MTILIKYNNEHTPIQYHDCTIVFEDNNYIVFKYLYQGRKRMVQYDKSIVSVSKVTKWQSF